MSENTPPSASDAVCVIASTMILALIALVVHLKYGPIFVQAVWLDRVLFVCFGALLGENSSRIGWLHRKKRQGVLPSRTVALMRNLEARLVGYCVGGYLAYKLLGLALGQGKGLLAGLLITFGLLRLELKRLFGTVDNHSDIQKGE